MRRLVWLSDTHINVLPRRWRRRLFVDRVKASHPDVILVTGDISSGGSIENDITWLSRAFSKQRVMFVMGNHDYHGRSFQEVNESVSRLVETLDNVSWLTESGVVTLADDVALVGDEGWYDAGLGDPSLLRWTMDWLCIEELRRAESMARRIEMFIDLATNSAIRLERSLVLALQDHKTVYVATHFPPWSAATDIPGTRFESFWLPYSVNTIMGKTIENVARSFPENRIVVLSGHTHIPTTVSIAANVECRVSKATRWGRVPDRHVIDV